MRSPSLAAVVLAAALLSGTVPSYAATSVAVFNFQMTSETPEWRWLEKGLSDRIATDFVQDSNLAVVARDEMQVLAQKMAWVPEMATTDAGAMGQVRRQLKIEHLVTGVYSIEGEQIRITGQIIEVAGRQEVARKELSGPAAEVLDLQRRLSAELLSWFTRKPADQVLPLLPVWTRSLPAARALYEGMDLYDHGRYGEAWLQFRQAARADEGYVEAVYWVGKMYYFMNRYEHARRMLERFVYLDTAHPRLGDALVEYLHTYESLDAPPKVLHALYDDFRRRCPDIPFMNISWGFYRSADWLGAKALRLLEQTEQDRDALERMLDLAPPGVPPVECLICFLRHHALTGETLHARTRPNLLHTLAAETPVFLNDGRPAEVQVLAPRASSMAGPHVYRRRSWGLFAPSGYVFRRVHLRPEIGVDKGHVSIVVSRDLEGDVLHQEVPAGEVREHGILLESLPRTAFLRGHLTVTVDEPVPDPRVLLNGVRASVEFLPLGPHGALEVACRNTTLFRVEVDRRVGREGPGIVGLVPPGRRSLRFLPLSDRSPFADCTLTVTVTAGKTTSVLASLPWKAGSPWSAWTPGVLLGQDYAGHDLVLERAHTFRPAVHMDAHAIRVVWARGGDLWASTSTDGEEFCAPAKLPLPVSSAWEEYGPVLVRDETGRFVLFLNSNRDGQHMGYLYATWSRDFEHWSAPAMILRDMAFTFTPHPVQDAQGRFVAAYGKWIGGYSSREQFLSSRDAYHWRPLGEPSAPPKSGSAFHRRSDGRYELICQDAPVTDPRHPTIREAGTKVTLYRYLSSDAVNWSAPEKVGEFLYSRGRSTFDICHSLNAAEVDGQTVLCLLTVRRADQVPELKFLRERPDGLWEASSWFEGVHHRYATFAWHPRWGFVLVSMTRENRDTYPHPAWGPYILRGPSLDPFFEQTAAGKDVDG